MRRNAILIMALPAAVAAVLALGAGVAAAGLVGGPGDEVLQGAFECPPADLAGFPLDPTISDTSSDPIHCEYPAVPGLPGFVCTYSATTGALVQDNNAGLCPANAVPIDPVPSQPVASDDSYSTAEDTLLTVAAPGVLGNDSDADGNALTAVLVSGPAHAASFTLNADGSFSYMPAANYNGPDSFTYKASDGTADSNTATVSLNVTSVNDPPTVAVAAGGSCASKTSGAMNVTVADIDHAASDFLLSRSSSNTQLVPNANIAFGGSGASRTVTVTVVPRQIAESATITIFVTDGQNTTTTVLNVALGTNKNETLTGTGGADMLLPLNGLNTVNAGDGIDLVCGGTDADTIGGGSGDDTIDGGPGNDTLRGDDGNDTLRGAAGSDRLEGGNHDDTLTGGFGRDSFSGGPGTDTATDITGSQGDTQDGTVP